MSHSTFGVCEQRAVQSFAVSVENEASSLDRHLGGTCESGSILESTTGSEFIRSVARAEIAAAQAVDALDDMVLWVERLKPYFERDPKMTVAQALQLYLNDRPSKTQRRAGSSRPG